MHRGCFWYVDVNMLQEGVGAEAAAFSAHEQLDNLIILYDSNDVTLDKMAEYTMSEDTATRYASYGWDVVTIDGHDLNAVSQVVFFWFCMYMCYGFFVVCFSFCLRGVVLQPFFFILFYFMVVLSGRIRKDTVSNVAVLAGVDEDNKFIFTVLVVSRRHLGAGILLCPLFLACSTRGRHVVDQA